MSVSKAQLKASERYVKEKLDQFTFRVPKGEKEKIKAHAASMGESVNGYIYRVIREDMEKNR